MIRLDPTPYISYISHDQQFLVRADEPVSVSVAVVDGRMIAHVYRGVLDDDDHEAEPLGGYDGTLPDRANQAWSA